MLTKVGHLTMTKWDNSFPDLIVFHTQQLTRTQIYDVTLLQQKA